MTKDKFTQFWEDQHGEEWEVQYHMEDNKFDPPWIEIDAITSVVDGRDLIGHTDEIHNFVTKNHEDNYETEEEDYYGEE